MIALVVLTVTLLSVTLSVRTGEDDRRFIDLKKVPLVGLSTRDFVPEDWLIEREIMGDINGDHMRDIVLALVERDRTADKERYRALVVVAGSRDGKLHRIAVADRLLADLHSGGMKCGSGGENVSVTLTDKGVLIVSQCLGGADLISFKHRFKYDLRLKRIVLIGADSESGSPPYQLTVTSTNYLSGVRITKRFDQRHPKGITKRTNISTRRKYLIDEMDYEDLPN